MALTYGKLGWEERISSFAALDPVKRIVDEQNRFNTIFEPYSVAAVDKAIAEHVGIERILTPSMIINQAVSAADRFTVPETGIFSPESTALEKRAAALKSVFGIWKDRQDVPEDGLAYQQGMRAEWR